MPGVSKIIHKGKEILYIDYDGCKNDQEMIDIMHEAQKTIINDNKEYLQLSNMTNAFLTPSWVEEVKRAAKETPRLARKRAIIGMGTQSKKILLQTYNLILGAGGIKRFDTLENAKDWLIS